MANKYRYSEIFRSIQGEGYYTGRPTVWYRAWGCNFECLGFGSKNPKNVDREKLPMSTIDATQYDRVEDLPVFNLGCDSSYSWSKKFSHLAKHETAEEIVTRLENLLPDQKFGDYWHMAFTGGEPMLSQTAIVDIMWTFVDHLNVPKNITFETNGSRMPREPFIDMFGYTDETGKHFTPKLNGVNLFWSCSPKLSASGEDWDRAIKPQVLQEYNRISTHGQLKYVVDGTYDVWKEVEEATRQYRAVGVNWPIYIMPVGATVEEQEEVQKEICLQTLDRGYNFSPRVHCWIFGNEIGT